MTDSKRHLHRYIQPTASHRPSTLGELSILQKHHQFIRDENDDTTHHSTSSSSQLSWEEKLSLSWYNKLFREYALCDLSQYKTGGVAMRWRTEEEVLDRVGELTCSHLECKYHRPAFSPRPDRDEDDTTPLVPKQLTPYQLNFRYEEQGKVKQALVKVVLCDRCSRKLTWKKDREREQAAQSYNEQGGNGKADRSSKSPETGAKVRGRMNIEREHRHKRSDKVTRRTSRSRSPERKLERHRSRREAD